MTIHNEGVRWFLAQLKPNCANIADKNLKRQGFKTFLPREEWTRKKSGKFVTTTRPLFSGYIFVAFDVAKGLWSKINATSGVTRLVCLGREPTVVPTELILELKKRCDDDGKLLPPEALKAGDHVALTKGPFANFAAEVEQFAQDRRAWVLLDLMGMTTRVAVAVDHLRSV